jgi:hypothetical protein
MNGFKIAVAVADPAQGSVDQEDLRYEADLSYAGAFDGGSYTAWLSGMMQDADLANADQDAYTVGGTLKVAGFEAMAQYSDSEVGNLEYDQYIVQAGYRFAGTTLVSGQYAERSDEQLVGSDLDDERYTFGVYHDVNANLKLIAEYTNVEMDNGASESDIFSLGGFVFF